VSIGAISGGSSASAWDYYKELKASQSGSVDAGAQDPGAALVSSATPSSADGAIASGGSAGGATGGGADRFGQLLNDMQTFYSDYTSASGSASGSIANSGTALSSGGTLSAALMTDLSVIAKDLTGIINGQNPVPSASTAAATAMQTILPASTSGDSAATSGPATDGTDSGMTGHPHHRRHDVQEFSPSSDQTMTQGTTLASTPNAAIDQLIAKTASQG
jgi:hypothetical protein